MYARSTEISPADRTVGQLVADTIRLYQRRFWRSLALGLVVAVFDQLAVGAGVERAGDAARPWGAVLHLAYIGACSIVLGEPADVLERS